MTARARPLFRLAILAVVTVTVALGAGFLWFTDQVARREPIDVPLVDGIVALTGGSSRLTDATQLLADGHGRRLLITGIHPATSKNDLARTVSDLGNLMDCCVDLDYEAVNTIGNAVETRRWVELHGFRSLLVVTSAYHMPRTLLELKSRLPNVKLVPFSVVSDHFHLDHWWTHPPTMQLLMREYAKYLLVLTRQSLGLNTIMDEPARPPIPAAETSTAPAVIRTSAP